MLQQPEHVKRLDIGLRINIIFLRIDIIFITQWNKSKQRLLTQQKLRCWFHIAGLSHEAQNVCQEDDLYSLE